MKARVCGDWTQHMILLLVPCPGLASGVGGSAAIDEEDIGGLACSRFSFPSVGGGGNKNRDNKQNKTDHWNWKRTKQKNNGTLVLEKMRDEFIVEVLCGEWVCGFHRWVRCIPIILNDALQASDSFNQCVNCSNLSSYNDHRHQWS